MNYCDCACEIDDEEKECLSCRRFDLFGKIEDQVRLWGTQGCSPVEALTQIAKLVNEGAA